MLPCKIGVNFVVVVVVAVCLFVFAFFRGAEASASHVTRACLRPPEKRQKITPVLQA